MVKLTAELIEQAAQYTNAVRDRELDLRGESGGGGRPGLPARSAACARRVREGRERGLGRASRFLPRLSPAVVGETPTLDSSEALLSPAPTAWDRLDAWVRPRGRCRACRVT